MMLKDWLYTSLIMQRSKTECKEIDVSLNNGSLVMKSELHIVLQELQGDDFPSVSKLKAISMVVLPLISCEARFGLFPFPGRFATLGQWSSIFVCTLSSLYSRLLLIKFYNPISITFSFQPCGIDGIQSAQNTLQRLSCHGSPTLTKCRNLHTC